MITGPNYQLLVTNDDLITYDVSVQESFKSISGSNRGKILILDEDDNTNKIIANMKRFSLYQYRVNDKGEEVLMKHSGALPIVLNDIQNKTKETPVAGVPHVWELDLTKVQNFCCKDYGIRFGIYSEALQKTQFPNELIENFSAAKECCDNECAGTPSPFNAFELIYELWKDVNLGGNYVEAYLNDGTGFKGRAEFEAGVAIDTSDSNSAFVKKMWFVITGEEKFKGGSGYSMNLKYDRLRGARARMSISGGFECSGATFKSNDDVTLGGPIQQKFAYEVGSGYDVRQMEYTYGLYTLNSPYTLSCNTFSENGIQYVSDTAKTYNIISMEYNQASEGVTRLEHHPHGTIIAIEAGATHAEWDNFEALIGLA